MVVKHLESNINVLEAARIRIINAFNTGLKVFLSMSGGKDSICLADITIKLIQEGKINPKQLTVGFLDEEAVFDDVEKIVLAYRRKFMLLGVKFEWYCVQVRHYNCLNSLSEEENFITWDEQQKENWVRTMPSFAIKNHPLLRERKDTYQMFFERLLQGSISLIGIRADESLMRRKNLAVLATNPKNDGMISNGKVYAIYDWSDDDIWLYIKQNKLDFPQTYLDIYQIGEGRRGMRLSQFFSIDTAKILVQLNEFQPDLMARVMKREPNAYIASLYWDTELFRRSKKGKKKIKEENGQMVMVQEAEADYKAMVLNMLRDIPNNFDTVGKIKNAYYLRKLVINSGAHITQKHYKQMYNILIAGDPKHRAIRGLITGIFSEHKNATTKELKK